MKKLLLILFCLPILTLAQKTYVPDDNFEAYLEATGMGDGIMFNDSVLTGSINTVTTLNVNSQNISDLTGIEDFTALTELYCYVNQLTSLDASNNPALEYLECYNNNLTSLDVSNNTNLTVLNCCVNQLTSLDVSNNLALTHLACEYNQLISLDVSSNTALQQLDCLENQLTSLDVSNNINLNFLTCFNNQLTSLDVSNNAALTDLYCFNNQLTSIDLRNHTLQNLSISTQSNPNLFCVDVDNPTLAQVLFTNIDTWTSFDTNCVTALGCTDTLAYNYDSTATINDGSCYYGKTYVPDDNFEAYLEAIGMGDGIMLNDSVLTGNINTETSLSVNNQYISDLTGIEDFIALTYLNCNSNQLTSLDVSSITALTYLNCESNQFTILDVSQNIMLIGFSCDYNLLTSIDVSGAINLTDLFCSDNQLTSLDISNNTALDYLSCTDNQLTSLDVSQNTALTTLSCTNNQITSLDLSQNTTLQYLYCDANQLTSLDLSNHTLQNLNINTTYNQNLFCIDVDNPIFAQLLFSSNIDSWTSFDTNCVTALGCTDSTACNYIPNATVDDGSCLIGYGCTDSLACNYNSTAQCDDGSCLTLYGCTDSLACNYNSTAQCDDGSCLTLYGCTDSLACNYNSTAQCDDGSCLTLYGCTDSLACNYNSTAQCDDGGCTYIPVTLNNSQVTCPNFSDATLTVNYNTGSYTYLWSNGETTQSIDSLPMGSYSVIVTDSVGCSTNLNANVNPSLPPVINMFPEICYITVDSATGNNKVIIKPMANPLTSKFIIYKESSANIYSPIDTVNYNTLEYLDVSSNPMAQSYRYKISVLDTCSNESIKSDFHKTIHLTMSLGINGEVNLLWNTYEGYQPSDYLIFRSINNGAMNQISILPGTNLTYTDLTPPTGNLNYQVRAIAPNCNIIPFAKNSTNMLVSNVINHSTTAVNELVNSKKVIKITDLLGRETKQTNQPLFYIYDDGTVEKRIVIEQ